MSARKLRRPKEGRVIAGVAAGMANYLGIDVVWIRAIWLFLLIPGGLPGLIPYVIFWIVMPEED